jgi:hypothetical protein
MFEATSELSKQAPPAVQYRFWRRRHRTFPAADRLAIDSLDRYDRIARDPRYSHFTRIPERIVHCLNYFQLRCDQAAVVRILSSYYIFIAVVDNALDSGDSNTADIVFQHWDLRSESLTGLSDVAVATEHLKLQVHHQISREFRDELQVLSETVCQERLTTSIETYLEIRKAVGRLTADLSYVLIRPLFDADEKLLRGFMQEVGAVGCLVDSVIDLSADHRRGLLSFSPTRRDYLKLALTALREGLSIGVRHPRLSGVFLRAVIDNLRDRFIATAPLTIDARHMQPQVGR